MDFDIRDGEKISVTDERIKISVKHGEYYIVMPRNFTEARKLFPRLRGLAERTLYSNPRKNH